MFIAPKAIRSMGPSRENAVRTKCSRVRRQQSRPGVMREISSLFGFFGELAPQTCDGWSLVGTRLPPEIAVRSRAARRRFLRPLSEIQGLRLFGHAGDR